MRQAEYPLIPLMEGISFQRISGPEEIYFSAGIVCDSRKLVKGCVFVCIHGHVYDAHQYIPEAIEKGAVAIIISENQRAFSKEELIDFSRRSGVSFLQVSNTRITLAKISAAYFNHPADQLELIGITGTKGKTTSAYMVRDIFSEGGINAGLIGTVSYIVSDETKPASHTTPEAFELQSMLSDLVEAKQGTCIMEVSSLGLLFERVHGCRFRIGAFTNLYTDHISQIEHKNMQEYLDAKLKLFKQSACAAINADSSVGNTVIEFAQKQGPVFTYGIDKPCDCQAFSLKQVRKKGIIGTEFMVQSPWYNGHIFLSLPGRFNVYNALCAMTISGLYQIPFHAVRKALSKVSVPGRMQMIPNNQNISVFVDYAHNAASLEILLDSLREYCNGRIIAVFGCGGNRSRTRRTEMGTVSGHKSDLTIVTTDNPRDENPEDIIADILQGLKVTEGAFQVEVDRTAAIYEAISEAKSEDFVVIAGKGHENYQIFKDQTIYFDDAEVARDAMKKKTQKEGNNI